MALCREYENRFSRTLSGSEVYRLNHREDATGTYPLSDDMTDLLATALYYCERSGGAFDITIEPLSSQWDFKAEEPELPDPKVLEEMDAQDRAVANQSRYISNFGKYPVYRNTDVEFYGDASDGLEAQKKALSEAKTFIFMEYHAIEDSTSFAGIREILARKVKEGVEVRLLYDDVGSVGFISPEFIKRMEADGIQCRVFNPMVPMLHVFMNNRDHRKITVVDGKVGFTGGYNLADEYFNLTSPYGHWKDTGVRLEGDAVKNLTVLFLEMWNSVKVTDMDFARYLPDPGYTAKGRGFVQPYGDNPLDGEPVGENVYMNVIKNLFGKVNVGLM